MQSLSKNHLINTIYPHIDQYIPSPQYLLNRIILAPWNIDINSINSTVLSCMPRTTQTFYSVDTIVMEPGADNTVASDNATPTEYLCTLDTPNLPPGELILKPGCPLILLWSLAPACGLCNGTWLILREAMEQVLEVQIIGGDHHGEIALIPHIRMNPGQNSQFNFCLWRLQFPVALAFAIMINKAQGQSVHYVGVDLHMPVFTHGQLYVALSRSTSHNHVHILLPHDSPNQVQNIIYNEILIE